MKQQLAVFGLYSGIS